MDQHLTVREACKFSGKSESTIKRLIREIMTQPDHADRGMLLPPPEEVERRRKAGDPFIWKINQDLLRRRFPGDASEKGSGGSDSTSPMPSGGSADSAAIIQVLREQLQSKDGQIRTLETQLDRKDDQIKNLNERMHESNVLMRELQARLAIAAPAARPSNDTVVEADLRKGTDQSKTKTETTPARKRSLFGGLFRRK